MLREPLKKVKARTTPRKRDYATRKPPDYEVKEPGDLIEIDTMDVRPEPGYVFKQFSAGDVISKWGFSDVRTAATSSLAREFLEELIRASPFKVEGVQVDGGSEFYGDFEQACKELGIRLFTLPPRSPKLNGVVERLNRTFREEFCACYDGELTLEAMRPALKRWTSEVYNQLRPHQSLGYVSPARYLETLGIGRCVA
ncbi:MAG: transposase family protein [Firmicutes bacterium]|nr:transposase family protein [Candidatus Fermentithermobacillaceae bacterium]